MFSWPESLSSLGVGSLGCGKQMPVMFVEPSLQIQRNPASCPWIVVSCSCEHTESKEAFGVIMRGGMGSEVVFSSTAVETLVEWEASDIWL